MLIESPCKTVAFAEAAKCGSRTARAWMLLCEKPHLFTDHPEWFTPSRTRAESEYHEITRRTHTDIPGNAPLFPDDLPSIPHPIRACIIADPVKRLCSGFRNRILFHQTLKGMENATLQDFIDRFGELMETDDGINRHFKPQRYSYGPDPKWFTHIFRIEEMDGFRRLLESTLSISLPELHLQQSGDIPPIEPTPAQIAWIQGRYAVDMAFQSC